jgi:hypothetical protein
MTDLLQQEVTGAPVVIVIAGKEYPLRYDMAAAIIYKAETARIERNRPQLPDPDPKCLRCDETKSMHEGPELIRLDKDKHMLCWGFRQREPLEGDSLANRFSWSRIDLDLDPERWLACLWAGLHQLQPDEKAWKAPMTLGALGGMLPVGPGLRELSTKMAEALIQHQPRVKEPDRKNADAPAAQTTPAPIAETRIVEGPIPEATTSTGSGPGPSADLALVDSSS